MSTKAVARAGDVERRKVVGTRIARLMLFARFDRGTRGKRARFGPARAKRSPAASRCSFSRGVGLPQSQPARHSGAFLAQAIHGLDALLPATRLRQFELGPSLAAWSCNGQIHDPSVAGLSERRVRDEFAA